MRTGPLERGFQLNTDARRAPAAANSHTCGCGCGGGGGGRWNRLRTRCWAPSGCQTGLRYTREPVATEVAAFAPATVANLGPGFDWLGCAIEGDGDTVVATPLYGREGVAITSIIGDNGKLPLSPAKNCVGIGAAEALRLIGDAACGVSLSVIKGLPLGSGLGSSAASAAAGAQAVNLLFGSPLSKEELVVAALAAEAGVSGYHADNVAPALLGGFVLVRSCNPLEVHRLDFPGEMHFALVTPKFESPTAQMRAVLPDEVALLRSVNNSTMSGALVAAIMSGNAALFGRCLSSDEIIEPVRGPLIPGFQAVKEAALGSGAFGCTIAGAGPTVIAVVPSKDKGEEVAVAMQEAFRKFGKLDIARSQVAKLNQEGASKVYMKE